MNAAGTETPAISCTAVIAGLDPIYGGPSYSVPLLCKALARQGVPTTLLSVAGAACESEDDRTRGYCDRRFVWNLSGTPVLRGLRWSNGLRSALRDIAPETSVVHNHGLWLMPNIAAGHETARAKKPLIVSPRGMLNPAALAYSRWKKRLVWHLAQGAILRQAACIHVTSEMEYKDVRDLGIACPVAVIPNGVDLPAPNLHRSEAEERIVLSLGRIHPVKGLDRLLRAWALVEPEYSGWRLEILGPADAGYDEELRTLAQSLKLQRVSIGQGVYGAAKNTVYGKGDLFVLASLTENFGLVAAEALAAGVPVISTKGAPWSGLERERCGWWVEHGVEPLAVALREAMALPPEVRRAMGSKGRAWMERDFSWDASARDMISVYRWACGRGDRPPIVNIH